MPATHPARPGAQRFVPFFTLLAWYAVLCLVLRLVLWARFGPAVEIDAGALGWILPAGLVADLVQGLYLLAPFALFLLMNPERWHRRRGTRALLLGGALLWMCAMLFVAACEYFFFEEFDARFNLVSVDYLIYPTEVAGDVWVEYPVIGVLGAAIALAMLSCWGLRRWLVAGAAQGGSMEDIDSWPARTRRFAAIAAATALAALFFSTNTLGRSANRVANELAANGPSSFFRALRTSEIDYHAYYATREPAANFTLVAEDLVRRGGGEFTARRAAGRLERSFPARAGGLGKLNVVLVSSESFGAEFSRLYGSERDWTPEFDRYAQQALWFRNAYASGTRTVRGLEAISASFPPIPTDSIVRRPGNDDLSTLGKVLRAHGYSTTFMYGGYGYFDNMNAFYSANGYEVLDRNSMATQPRFANIWGVADEDLFDFALEHADRLARSGKPFFIHVMNTSNHKPFTFRPGLEHLGILPSGGGRESGVRYADFAQGYFLKQAAQHAWFDDTIFIVVADHGARVYGKQEIPLRSYEIPLMIYAPKHIAPRRIDGLMTQIDIAPTLLGLLGLPYTAAWFGQDALNSPEAGRIAFFSHNHDVALYRDGALAILGLQKTITHVSYDRATDTYQPTAHPDPAFDDLAIAYYQTAYELFKAHLYE